MEERGRGEQSGFGIMTERKDGKIIKEKPESKGAEGREKEKERSSEG